MHNRPIALLTLLLLTGCVPGEGTIKIVGDTNLGFDGTAVPPGNEFRVATPDTGVIYDTGGGKRDTGGLPQPDKGTTPKPDTKPALCPPKGPFGTGIGSTANTFNNIPDCGGTGHSLHPLCGKYKGFVIAMMSPS